MGMGMIETVEGESGAETRKRMIKAVAGMRTPGLVHSFALWVEYAEEERQRQERQRPEAEKLRLEEERKRREEEEAGQFSG